MKTPWRIGHLFEGAAFAGVAPRVVAAVATARTAWGVSQGNRHAFWVLDYSVDDCGLCRVQGAGPTWFTREPGIAHLYAPGTRYWEDSRQVAGCFESRYAIFAGGQLAGLNEFVQNSKGFGRFQDPAGVLGEQLRRLALAAQDGDGAFWRVQGLLAELFVLLRQLSRPAAGSDFVRVVAAPSPGVATGLAERLTQWLAGHYSEPFSLAALARRLNVSPSTLTHKYKQLTGESPLQTLVAIRVNHAKEMLLRGRSLKMIAAETGFYDPFHLSKVFKKKTGLTPREYLKRHGA